MKRKHYCGNVSTYILCTLSVYLMLNMLRENTLTLANWHYIPFYISEHIIESTQNRGGPVAMVIQIISIITDESTGSIELWLTWLNNS